MPSALLSALREELSQHPSAALQHAAAALRASYRPESSAPRLVKPAELAAYAAYRMPATYAASRAAFAQVARQAAGNRPQSLLDVGGGTGAASWAAIATWPSLSRITVLDRSQPALDLGGRLTRGVAVLSGAERRAADLATLGALPAADVVVASYVVGELDVAARQRLVGWMSECGELAVVVEPGSRQGYATVLAARTQLLAAGRSVVAPCPHDHPCPLAGGPDWCHFGVRLARSAAHRAAKGAARSFEDEPYSYVAAARTRAASSAAGRVLRRPSHGKGLVRLSVCAREGGVEQQLIPRSRGQVYRAARDTRWGDPWP